MQQQRIDLLQGMPVFGGLTRKTLEYIMEQSQVQMFSSGEYLFREHEPAQSLMVLEKGSVAILKGRQGAQYLLSTLHEGDCIGEMSLLDLQPRSASVLALADGVAICMSTQVLYELYKLDLPQFTLMQLNMAREVCRRLRQSDNLLFDERLATGTPPQPFQLNEE